jgi:hypothetical protein
MKALLAAIWKQVQALNRSKVVNGIGAFFALATPVLLVVVKGLPPAWSVTLLIASAIGVLSRAQYIWQQVVPLLDGSSVVQVKPPTPGVAPSLLAVAQDTRDVPKQSVPDKPSEATPITMPNRPRDKGAINGWLLAVLAGIGLGLCVMFAWTSTAHAQEPSPQFGWCSADGSTCVGPSLSVTLTRITADGKVQAGINPGICYGVTRDPSAAYAFGIDGCLAFALNQSGLGANVLSPALLFKLNKFRAGVSAEFTQTPGVGLSRVIGFAFGGGFDVQALTQFYARAQAQEAVQADRAAQAAKAAAK